MVIDTFLGGILHLSSPADGAIKVIENPTNGIKTYSLELDQQPEELEDKKVVRFKVMKS